MENEQLGQEPKDSIVVRFFNTLGKKILSFIASIGLFFKRIALKVYHTIVDMKDNPKATLNALLSALIPGLGQLRNKQKYKFFIFFGVFLVFLIVELLTGGYFQFLSERGDYESVPFGNFFRDYGGMFTYGVWGFLTLGTLIKGVDYRGIEDIDNVVFGGRPSWAVADNSQELLGAGSIALIFVAVYLLFYFMNIKDAYKGRKKVLKNEKLDNFKEFKKNFFDNYFAVLIMIPAIILVFLFILVPFIFSFSIAFTSFENPTGIETGEKLFDWVGLSNFLDVFKDNSLRKYFVSVSGWTLFYAIMASFTVFAVGMLTALFIESKHVKYKKVFRIFMIIPWAIPALVSLMAFRSVFTVNGLADTLLVDLGILEPVKQFLSDIGLVGQSMTDIDGNITPIAWVTHQANGNLAKTIVIMVNLWLGWPYFMMLVTGVLGTVPKSLYEAADMDGATDFQKFRYITFPWIMKASIPVIISTFTFNFNNFGAIYFLTGGGPKQANPVLSHDPGQTDILISWIYKMSFENKAYNVAAVYSVLIFIFIATFAIWNLSRVKSFWEED